MIQKRTTKGTQKNTIVLLAVMVMLMATLLTACGSNKAAAPSNEAETTKVETAKAEETEPTETTEVEEVAEAEPTAEPTPEPVVYEGIDMESTLPGEEWIQTFNGIIDEPKLVVFNDSTNKKVIVEEGQEVEMEDSDIMAIYLPKEGETVIKDLDNNVFKHTILGDVIILDRISGRYHNGDKALATNNIKYNGQDMTLTAVVVVKRDE